MRRVDDGKAAERMALALRLGDEDLERYQKRHGVDREEAMRVFRRRRQIGRTPSRAAAEP